MFTLDNFQQNKKLKVSVSTAHAVQWTVNMYACDIRLIVIFSTLARSHEQHHHGGHHSIMYVMFVYAWGVILL